jgi:hypothetical protein
MTAAPKVGPCGSGHAGIVRCAEPVVPWVRPTFSGKNRVDAPERHRGVGVRAPMQGLQRERREGPSPSRDWRQPAKTPCPRETEGPGRDLVWRMSQYERRPRGNALAGGLRGHPRRGNAWPGQRGSRHLAGMHRVPGRDTAPDRAGQDTGHVEPSGKPRESGVYVRQRLRFGARGKTRWGHARAANRTREIRPSGMKTGARGNVARGAGLRPAAKAGETPPAPTARAPRFYPNHLS